MHKLPLLFWALWTLTASTAFADSVDLGNYLPLTEQDRGQLRNIVDEVFDQFPLQAGTCPSASPLPAMIQICTTPLSAEAASLPAQWDHALGRVARDWGGAGLPWRQILSGTQVIAYSKSFAKDLGTTVLLMRVKIQASSPARIDLQMSKHPWN